jgi:hypothetical protein
MSNDDHKPMTEDQARKYRIKASGFRKTWTSMNPGRISVSRWSRVFLANSTAVLSNEPKGAAIHIEVPLAPFHHNE